MLVVRAISINANSYMLIPINFVNTTYKVLAWHWTSMTTGQSTYTITTIDWSTSPPLLHINITSAANNDTCYFKVTFV
jgi:hypothetical protein